MSGKAWLVAALAVGLGAQAAEAAADDMSLRAFSSPDTIAVPETKDVTHRLAVEAGSQARRFQVHVEPHWFYGQSRGADWREGPPIQALSRLRGYSVDGDLVIEGGGGTEALIVCPGGAGRYHGLEPTTFTANLYIPAGGRGTLFAKYHVTTDAPWRTTDYRARFTVSPKQRTFWWGELDQPPAPGAVPTVDALPPPLTVVGRRGVEIVLEMDPPRRPGPGRHELPAGAEIGVSGHTDPPLRGQKIELLYRGPETDREMRHLAFTRTDDQGRFGLRAWRPRIGGHYELQAVYHSQAADVADDFACGQWLHVLGDSDPAPELLVDSGKARVSRGKVTLPVRCAGAPPARCAGVATLTAPKRRWRASVRYDREAPSSGILSFKVPRKHGGSALLTTSPSGPARPAPPRRIKILPPKR